MKNKIFEIKPPKEYIEGLIEIDEGLDSIPELVDYLKHGFSMNEAKKMCVLLRIESMKHYLKSVEDSVGDVKQIEKEIESVIEEYNKM